MKPILAFALCLLLLSCQKDYNVVLPAHTPELVIECYLEDGKPLRALVSESTELLDTSLIPPVLIDAVVTITHRGTTDTLAPFVYIDTARRRAYNYGSTTLVRADYASREPYRIDVWDRDGRHAWGVTYFMPLVPITSITPTFNDTGRAYSLTRFADEPGMKNWYRLIISKNAREDSIRQDQIFDETFVNSNGDILYGSRYNYASGDSIHGQLFHLTEDYYQYLNTLRNARGALGNPFAVSGEVVSNIRGGTGVFAALSVTRLSVGVP